MAIHDSSPERRNLTVLSMSIIAFFLAEGKITGDVVRLQVVNASFDRPEVLAYFVWGLLIWFCFRYWLVNQGSWKKPFFQELNQSAPKIITDWYLVKRFSLPKSDFTGSYYPDRHWLLIDDGGGHKLSFKHVFKNPDNTQGDRRIEIEGIKDKVFLTVCSFYLFFRKPVLSGYFIPYLLFLYALYLGVINAL